MNLCARLLLALFLLQTLLATPAQAGFAIFSAPNPHPAPIHRAQAAIDFVVIGARSGTDGTAHLDASANAARGHANGDDTVQRNTHVVAGNTVNLQSGADTTIAGATVTAPTVHAQVGGNLNIESRQDTSSYESQQKSAGAGVSLCIPPLCYGASSVSGSAAAQNIESTLKSVGEQSGIRAGRPLVGFDPLECCLQVLSRQRRLQQATCARPRLCRPCARVRSCNVPPVSSLTVSGPASPCRLLPARVAPASDA